MKENTSLLVHGLSDQHKEFLYQYAQKELGSRSRTKAIIALIDEKMEKEPKKIDTIAPLAAPNGKKKRLQLSLREAEYNLLDEFTKSNDTSIQFYVVSLILKDLYNQDRLLGNEIEVLRKSNYELYKIGVNVNQVAKALNMGEQANLPINHLHQQITKHIEKVEKILRDSLEKY